MGGRKKEGWKKRKYSMVISLWANLVVIIHRLAKTKAINPSYFTIKCKQYCPCDFYSYFLSSYMMVIKNIFNKFYNNGYIVIVDIFHAPTLSMDTI